VKYHKQIVLELNHYEKIEEWNEDHTRLINWGARLVKDGDETVTVELEIDMERLAQVAGLKAYRNKSKQSRECSGLVIARILK
jgi:hypothetical protein